MVQFSPRKIIVSKNCFESVEQRLEVSAISKTTDLTNKLLTVPLAW